MFGYTIFGCTETGLVRTRNEDHILIGRHLKNRGDLLLKLTADDDFLQDYGFLLAVADGIGGTQGGDTASRLALLTLERHFYAMVKHQTPEAFRQALSDAIEKANHAVLQAAANHAALAGMGCTLAGIMLSRHGCWQFSSGDSRIYRCRNRMLKRLTLDDTVTERNTRLGLIDPRDSHDTDDGHTLTNWIGKERYRCSIEPLPELQHGDRLLVCTDGLHGLVDENLLGEQLGAIDTLIDQLGQRLLKQALEQGGWDNISMILLDTKACH